MIAKKSIPVIMLCGAFFFLSFTRHIAPCDKTNIFYERQSDSLLARLQVLQRSCADGSSTEILKTDFLACRNAYKKIEFFVDLFDPFRARLVNGPDLLILEEENPGDSLKPHGLQVIETMLYSGRPDRKRLAQEIGLLTVNIKKLAKDPDHIYYFKNDRIWWAMRLGVYRIVSLGISGFDVPLSYHSLPEIKATLSAMKEVTGFYKKETGDSLNKKGNLLFDKAIACLSANNNFNTFDRAVFIRDYINPLSAWLTICSSRCGYIGNDQRNPLNQNAANLFAPDAWSLSFFSPNSKFRMTAERVALGKKLFYDPVLSGNGSRSCASCHQPQHAFTDAVAKPTDLSGNKILLRNTPTLWNAALQTRQFYDMRTETLENQLSAVVHNTDEMNGSLSASVGRLMKSSEYASMFTQAYPGSQEAITEYTIANAISSYVRSLISLNSRFDRYIRHQTDSFSREEKNGFNLFMGKAKCGTCHYAPLFNGLTPPLYQETESEQIGVPATGEPLSVLDADPGRSGFTRVPYHRYFFRTQTVRNIALTAPYMHNGVFKTLEDVINFYNDGGGAGRGIDLATQTLPVEKLKLSHKEINNIIAFLGTLTDTSGTSLPQY